MTDRVTVIMTAEQARLTVEALQGQRNVYTHSGAIWDRHQVNAQARTAIQDGLADAWSASEARAELAQWIEDQKAAQAALTARLAAGHSAPLGDTVQDGPQRGDIYGRLGGAFRGTETELDGLQG